MRYPDVSEWLQVSLTVPRLHGVPYELPVTIEERLAQRVVRLYGKDACIVDNPTDLWEGYPEPKGYPQVPLIDHRAG
jgi:hypothetical protein